MSHISRLTSVSSIAFTPKFASQDKKRDFHPELLSVMERLRTQSGTDIEHCLSAAQPAFDSGLTLTYSSLIDGEVGEQLKKAAAPTGRRQKGAKPQHARFFDSTRTGQLQYDVWQRVTPSGLSNDQCRIALSSTALPDAPNLRVRRSVTATRNALGQLLLQSTHLLGTTSVESPSHKALGMDVQHGVVITEMRRFPEGLLMQEPIPTIAPTSVFGQTPGTLIRRLKIHGYGMLPGALVSLKGNSLPNGELAPGATARVRLYEKHNKGEEGPFPQRVIYTGPLFKA